MSVYDVYLNGKKVDTVFYNAKCDGGALINADDVKRGLIDHDGYDPAIIVRKRPVKRS